MVGRGIEVYGGPRIFVSESESQLKILVTMPLLKLNRPYGGRKVHRSLDCACWSSQLLDWLFCLNLSFFSMFEYGEM